MLSCQVKGLQEEVSRLLFTWEDEQEVNRMLAVMLKGQELRPLGAEYSNQKQGSERGRAVILKTRDLQRLASIAPG